MSESETDSTSSEEGFQLEKPLFVRRKQDVISRKNFDKKEVALSKAEQQQKIQNQESRENEVYDGIDDTDDLDPQLEYNQWKQREIERRNHA